MNITWPSTAPASAGDHEGKAGRVQHDLNDMSMNTTFLRTSTPITEGEQDGRRSAVFHGTVAIMKPRS